MLTVRFLLSLLTLLLMMVLMGGAALPSPVAASPSKPFDAQIMHTGSKYITQDKSTALPFSATYIIQQAQLLANDGAADDGFGTSVALSSDGTTALIGAIGRPIGSTPGLGAAYVFTRTGSSWAQQAQLLASDGEDDRGFGTSVALSSDGTTALIGAPLKTIGLTPGLGAAYVFTRTGSSWAEQARLTASDGAADDGFGIAAALSSDGSTALVGAASKRIGSNAKRGAAYVFTRTGSSWAEQAGLTASDGHEYDYFGTSVGLSGDGSTALIGAPLKTIGSNAKQGAAYVFTRTGSSWLQQAQFLANDGAADDYFGIAAALSSDGTTTLIGAPLKTVRSTPGLGAAYVFTR